MAVVLPSKASTVRKLLPAGSELTVLQVHPVAPALGQYLPAPAGVLVGIASRWSEFQRIARTMLIAAGIAPESLIVCNASKSGWQRGLAETAAVVCDAVTAADLPKRCRPIEFRLLAEGAIAQLQSSEAALTSTS
jgi:GntR family transcriptional regulator